MPEGPELHLASKFVNASCKGRVFAGKIVKSPVHKSSVVEFSCNSYAIAAGSRGKEMMLILTKIDEASEKPKNGKKLKIPETLKILFRFGMSGAFQFTPVSEVHKHAHLQFFTKDKPRMVLSYVDVRRFGRWEVGADWSKERGPDPMFDYLAFRSNVVKNLKNAAFDHPICETMLNQKYFNGIGNYLRAEILYRLKIPPFEKARTALEGLSEEPPDVKPKIKGKVGSLKEDNKADLLHLCHTVPLEVIAIGAGGYDADGKASDYSAFSAWLQCYYQDGMKNMVDHNKRTIWFTGPAGPMVPKEEKSRKPRSPKKKRPSSNEDEEKASASPTKKVKSEDSAESTDNDARKTTKTRQRKAPAAKSKPKAKPTRESKKIEKGKSAAKTKVTAVGGKGDKSAASTKRKNQTGASDVTGRTTRSTRQTAAKGNVETGKQETVQKTTKTGAGDAAIKKKAGRKTRKAKL